MLHLRIRLPELMQEHGIQNAYQLLQRSQGRLTTTKAYHLVRKGGNLSRLDLETLATLVEIFGLEKDIGALFEVGKEPRRQKGRR